jgi:2-polyprenyl-3-methyl-5-hydroxy-6-metoxy-1,4-benzoquinol methylase
MGAGAAEKMKEIRYRFIPVLNCNMCGAPASRFRLLGKRLNGQQGRTPWKKEGITTPIMQCRNCSLIFSNPQPVPLDIQDHYGIPPEQYWKNKDIFAYKGEFEHELGILKQLSTIAPGAKALDIGAGLGKSMITLEKAGFETYGLEPSEPFYRKAIEGMGIRPERLRLGMIESIDYPENEFDFITFGAVMEHLYSPGDAIVKAMKWLKPGGIIHVEVPSSRWLISRLMNFYYRMRGSDFVSNISPMHSPYHLYEFGLRSFELHGKANNYEVLSHKFHVCTTYLPKAADFFIRPYMSFTNSGMQLVIWLRKKG